MHIILLTGSVASGKTSLARILKNILSSRGLTCKYVDVNINHGFAYILTRFLTMILKYKYIGNHYLTIRFSNEILFCKYLQLMLFLDIIYIPIKYFTSLKTFEITCKLRKRNCIALLDEYYLNAIADYLYFSRELCKQKNGLLEFARKLLLRIFFNIACRISHSTLKGNKTMIIYMDRSLWDSIIGWCNRERTRIVDIGHIKFRSLVTRILLCNFQQYFGDNFVLKEYFVRDFTNTFVNIAHQVLEFIQNREATNTVLRT